MEKKKKTKFLRKVFSFRASFLFRIVYQIVQIFDYKFHYCRLI